MSTRARVTSSRDTAAGTLTLTVDPGDAPDDLTLPLLAAHLGYITKGDTAAFLKSSAVVSDTTTKDQQSRVIVIRVKE